jgi:hypothetical protein
MSKRITTYDHKEIKEWATARKGSPVLIYKSKPEGKVSSLAIDFQEKQLHEETMEKIEWEKFFELFEKRLFALQYDEKEGGEKDLNYKFVGRTL